VLAAVLVAALLVAALAAGPAATAATAIVMLAVTAVARHRPSVLMTSPDPGSSVCGPGEDIRTFPTPYP
jgi:hypothetical protein